jgi:hypothetical protein
MVSAAPCRRPARPGGGWVPKIQYGLATLTHGRTIHPGQIRLCSEIGGIVRFGQ